MKTVNYWLMQGLLLIIVACSGNELLPIEERAKPTAATTKVISLQRSEAEAKSEALKFVASIRPEVRGRAIVIDSVSYLLNEHSITNVRSRKSSQDVDTLLYVFNMREGGTIIASGKREVSPILAYLETEKPIDASILHERTGTGFDLCARNILKGGYDGSGGGPKKPYIPFIDYTIDKYGDTIGPNRPVSYFYSWWYTIEKSEPLIKTHWHQKWPYNAHAPIVNGEHALVGCAPMAIAKIASYFKHPKKMENKILDWERMVADTLHPDLPIFMRYLGHILNSKYNHYTEGTSTNTANIAPALDYLGIKYGSIDGYYTSKILADLKHKRPILISALSTQPATSNKTVGHMWVIDGYLKQERILYRHVSSPTWFGVTREIDKETQLYVHCNWGSGKHLNGYFLDKTFTYYQKPSIEGEQEAENHSTGTNYIFDSNFIVFYELSLK